MATASSGVWGLGCNAQTKFSKPPKPRAFGKEAAKRLMDSIVDMLEKAKDNHDHGVIEGLVSRVKDRMGNENEPKILTHNLIHEIQKLGIDEFAAVAMKRRVAMYQEYVQLPASKRKKL